MKPIQKDGRSIRRDLFSRLQKTGRSLERLGYVEHATKPNLFVRRYDSVEFYADLRGSSVIAMWEDERPLFYWRWRTRAMSMAVRRRVALIEGTRIREVEMRLSFEASEVTLQERSLLLETSLREATVLPPLRVLRFDPPLQTSGADSGEPRDAVEIP